MTATRIITRAEMFGATEPDTHHDWSGMTYGRCIHCESSPRLLRDGLCFECEIEKDAGSIKERQQ